MPILVTTVVMPTDSNDRAGTSRRSYLKLATAVAASAGVVGTATAGSLDDEYGTVVDVTEAGADPDGNESITPIIEELEGDDTLLKFPPGRYYVDQRIRVTDREHFGMVGDDATLVPATYDEYDDLGDWNYKLFRLGVDYAPMTDLRVENFTVDMSAANTGVRALDVVVDDGLVVRDVDVAGRHDTGAWGPGRFVVNDPDGSGLVERFKLPDGGALTANAPGDRLRRGPSGIICNDYNEGTVTFRDCVVNGFPDNGLYAANGTGSIHIEGGHFENNLGANVRLGGHDSYIRDATVVVGRDTDVRAQRGVRLENGNLLVVRNVDLRTTVDDSPAVRITDDADYNFVVDSSITAKSEGSNNAISVRPSGNQTRIKRTDITHDTGGSAAVVIADGDYPVFLRNVTVTGSAPADGYYGAIHNSRDDCEFRKVTVDHGGGDSRRALTNTGSNCMIYEGEYESESNAIVDGGDSTWIEGMTARSRRDEPGLRLTDEASDIYVKKSRIVNGIEDYSQDGYSGWGNDLS